MKFASCGSEKPNLFGSGTSGIVWDLTRFQINAAAGFWTSVAQKCLQVRERERISAGDVEWSKISATSSKGRRVIRGAAPPVSSGTPLVSFFRFLFAVLPIVEVRVSRSVAWWELV